MLAAFLLLGHYQGIGLKRKEYGDIAYGRVISRYTLLRKDGSLFFW